MSQLINQPIPNNQTAMIIKEFGEPDVFQQQNDFAIPMLSDGQVLVKVAYAGINPVDYKTRQGLGWGADNIRKQQFANNQAAVLGFDVAGQVVASKDSRFNVGDKVSALSFTGGCYAQYVAVAGDLLAPIADGVDLKTAGAMPCVATTAKQLLDFADINQGEHVVINAPAGGVGHLLIQMLMGLVDSLAIQLSVICSAEKYQKLASLIDCDKLTAWIDYQQYGDEQAFPDLQADVLLDLVGGQAGIKALSTLKTNGKVYVLPSIWADKLKEAGADKSLQVEGFIAKPNAQDLEAMLQKVADKQLSVHIQATYPLTEVAKAHQELEKGDSFGKIVLQVAHDEVEE